jgi:hypothetical protein
MDHNTPHIQPVTPLRVPHRLIGTLARVPHLLIAALARVPHSSQPHRDEWDNRTSDPLSFPRRKYLLALAILIATTFPAQAQWDIKESHTTASLRGIHNVGGGVAWASGTEGTVLRTEDGGYLWQGCATPPGAEKLDFRGIQAFDENTAIVMSSGKGDLSRLYKTTDGCRTWKLVFINPDKEGFWDALQIVPSGFGLNGVLVGDPVNGIIPIFLTTDKGETWRQWNHHDPGSKGACKENPVKAQRDEGLFAASNQSLLFEASIYPTFLFVTGGKSGSRLISSDYSDWDFSFCKTSFHTDSIPFTSKQESSGAFAMATSKWAGGSWLPEKIIVVGGDYKKPDAPSETFLILPRNSRFPLPGLSTQSWLQRPIRSTTPPHGYRSAVAFDPTTKTWITVGPNGTDISRDDGRNWSPLKPTAAEPQDADKNWNALSLPFVVGPKGRIGKLRDNAIATAASSKEEKDKKD